MKKQDDGDKDWKQHKLRLRLPGQAFVQKNPTRHSKSEKKKQTNKRKKRVVGCGGGGMVEVKNGKKRKKKKLVHKAGLKREKRKFLSCSTISVLYYIFCLLVHSHMKQFPSTFLWSCYTGQTDEADEWNDKLHYITHEGVFSSSFSFSYNIFFNREKRQRVSKVK